MIRVSLAALILVGEAVSLQPTQQPLGSLQERLDAIVRDYTLSKPDLARALIAIASQFRISMGIEWIEPKPPRPVNLTWKRATVRQIIESVVKAQPGYECEVEGGMLHVFYKGAGADQSNFLNIRIPEFSVENTYVAMARHRLQQMVWATVSPPPPGQPISEGGEVILDPDDTRQNFRWQNTNVRDVLDKLTLAGYYKIWAVTFPESPARTSAGFRPTLSLWITQPRPNEFPDWDRFDWRHQPPPPLNELGAPAVRCRGGSFGSPCLLSRQRASMYGDSQ